MTLRQRFTEKIVGKGRIHRVLEKRRMKKRKIQKDIEARQKKFAKEFGSSTPKSFDVKPELPTRGKRRRFKII